MTREEALKIVSNIYQTDKEKEALGVLIPELADSEDERTRKELVDFLHSPFIKENLTDEKVAPWLAYLEKLKEQKPANVDYVSGIREELLGIEDNAKNIDGLTESQWVAIRAAHRVLGEYIEQEQKPVEIEEIIRKAKSEGRQEVIDNPEYYQLQKPEEWQKPDWSEEDKLWLSEVYFAIDHSMYSEVERQAMKKYIDYLRYQSQPKTSWNDEDEKNSAFIVAALDAYARLRKEKNNTSGQEDFDKAVSWIHDRLGFIRPQPKHEWSENSRKRLETIADYLRYKGYEDDADFIESIPPQQKEEGIKGVKGHPDPAGVWKPSDGQLKALKYFLAQHRLQMDASTTKWEEYDNLRSLYDILCKIAKS